LPEDCTDTMFHHSALELLVVQYMWSWKPTSILRRVW